jgi:hypothetical protein
MTFILPDTGLSDRVLAMELRNEELTVRLDEPGSRYKGTRFDWTSQVTSVRDALGIEYLGQEAPPGEFREDKGMGLASEFGIRLPIGYDDCAVGDWFPKIGVGWIRRESTAEYDFYHRYRELEPSPCVIVRDGEAAASLVMDGGVRRGWGWRLRRDWRLEGCELSCRLELENTGNHTLRTNEYAHNFVAPQAGAGLRRLTFSWGAPLKPGKLVSPDGNLAFDSAGVAIDITRGQEFYASDLGLQLPAGSWWELRQDDRPLVRETLDAPATHSDIWGKSSVVSAELFLLLELVPGQKRTWTRCWRFGA